MTLGEGRKMGGGVTAPDAWLVSFLLRPPFHLEALTSCLPGTGSWLCSPRGSRNAEFQVRIPEFKLTLDL